MKINKIICDKCGGEIESESHGVHWIAISGDKKSVFENFYYADLCDVCWPIVNAANFKDINFSYRD